MTDLLALRDEVAPPGTRPLLAPVMTDGTRTTPRSSLADAAARVRADLAELPAEARRIRDPRPWPVPRSPALEALMQDTRDRLEHTH